MSSFIFISTFILSCSYCNFIDFHSVFLWAYNWFPDTTIFICRFSVLGCDQYQLGFCIVFSQSPWTDVHYMYTCVFVSYLNLYTAIHWVFSCYFCSPITVFPLVGHLDTWASFLALQILLFSIFPYVWVFYICQSFMFHSFSQFFSYPILCDAVITNISRFFIRYFYQ